MIYSTKNKSIPVGRRILVYAYNVEKPGWYIDQYSKLSKSDLDGNFYPHNISHWAELPGPPKELL